jgi:hypothetical protein
VDWWKGGGGEDMYAEFWWLNLEVMTYLEKLFVDGSIILNYI